MVFLIFFSNYGLITWITTIFKSIHLGSPYLDSVIFAAGGLPANIVSAYVMDRIGGRLVMIISMGMGSLMLFAFAFEVGYAGFAKHILVAGDDGFHVQRFCY